MNSRKNNKKKIAAIIVMIVLILVITGCVVVIVRNKEARERAGEFAQYELWKSATIDKMANYCDIDLDKVDKIRLSISDAEKKDIGYIVDGERDVTVDYIIKDEVGLKELMDKLKDIKAYGASDKLWEDYDSEVEWDIRFYVGDMEYSMEIWGESIGEENVEVIRVGVFHSGAGREMSDEFPDPTNCLWSTHGLIYDKKLIDFVYEYRERYVNNLNIKDILDIYAEGDREAFFAYENSGGRMKEGYDITSDEIYTLLYTFPIDDFDGYVVVEKQNDGRDYGNGENRSAKDYVSYTDIVDVKIYNSEGEYIDFLDTTKEKLEEFLR